MKVLLSHWNALGTTLLGRLKYAFVVYGASSAVAVALWLAWDRRISRDTLTILATIQSIVATVLLTVIGSIYSGLPAAMLRARRARDFAESAKHNTGTDLLREVGTSVQVPAIRAAFENRRVDVLHGLFSHAAAAVFIALLSLPLTVVAMQLLDSDTRCANLSQHLSLVVLVLGLWTLAVVFLVLMRLHELVQIDVDDVDQAEA